MTLRLLAAVEPSGGILGVVGNCVKRTKGELETISII
jgi:hypothetical protein